jgi:hypothetical protein
LPQARSTEDPHTKACAIQLVNAAADIDPDCANRAQNRCQDQLRGRPLVSSAKAVRTVSQIFAATLQHYCDNSRIRYQCCCFSPRSVRGFLGQPCIDLACRSDKQYLGEMEPVSNATLVDPTAAVCLKCSMWIGMLASTALTPQLRRRSSAADRCICVSLACPRVWGSWICTTGRHPAFRRRPIPNAASCRGFRQASRDELPADAVERSAYTNNGWSAPSLSLSCRACSGEGVSPASVQPDHFW